MSSPPPVVILTGPTATGKTALSVRFARESRVPVEIINADSMLVYRGMDIGTAKPTIEERQGVPHHLIDIREPDEPFTAGEFMRAARSTIDEIEARGNRALIVGGTGFYLKALIYGMWEGPQKDPEVRARLEAHPNEELFTRLQARDPESAQRIGPSDRYRLVRALEIIEITGKTPTELQAAMPSEPDPRFQLWVIDRATDELFTRIDVRTQAMLDAGMIDETRDLLRRFPGAKALGAVGYAQVADHLAGRTPAGRKIRPGIPGLADEISLATRQLVKSQRTWFKGQKTARHFSLEQDLSRLEAEFKSIYP